MATILLFVVSILFGAFGALLMRIGAGQLGTLHLDGIQDILSLFVKMLTSTTVLAGMLMYFLSAATWFYLLTKLEVSVVQPILALTYVVTPILAIFFAGENVPPLRWLGILVIIFGVYIVARTAS